MPPLNLSRKNSSNRIVSQSLEIIINIMYNECFMIFFQNYFKVDKTKAVSCITT